MRYEEDTLRELRKDLTSKPEPLLLRVGIALGAVFSAGAALALIWSS